jgi:hypothetical protein
MSSDPNKKTARTFQCRDILWDAFDQMASEMECSVDYLINEAMKQYARQRYGGKAATGSGGRLGDTGERPAATHLGPPEGAGSRPTPPPPARQSGLPPPPGHAAPHVAPPPPLRRGTASLPPPPASRAGHALAPPGGRLPVPPSPAAHAPPPAAASRPAGPPPLARASAVMPAPPPARHPAAPAAASSQAYAGQLSAIYEGDRIPVMKDRFVIGRGKQSSDLTIKDPNVSRQHAMVEFLNGQYYMVDMGSTNGVEFNGQRITRRSISEGDIYKICDHEVRFTYK